jgi:hypothetical protein
VVVVCPAGELELVELQEAHVEGVGVNLDQPFY